MNEDIVNITNAIDNNNHKKQMLCINTINNELIDINNKIKDNNEMINDNQKQIKDLKQTNVYIDELVNNTDDEDELKEYNNSNNKNKIRIKQLNNI